jgi:DNA polymerase-3 subunit gamma/tau
MPPSEPAPGPDAPAPPPGPGPQAPKPPSEPAVANGAEQAAELAPPRAAGPALELEGLRTVWPAVIDAVRAENALCAALLEDAKPIAVDGSLVTVAFAPTDDFHRRKAEDDGYRRCVAMAVRTVTGAKAQIAYVLAEAPPSGGEEPAAAPPPTDDEWMRRLMSEFDAEEIVPDPTSESEAH